MSATYNWGLQCDPIVVPSKDGLANVVQTVHWTYTAADGAYTARAIGCCNLASPDPAKFKAFDSLTLDTVMEWVRDALGADEVSAMQEALAAQIAAQVDPNRPRTMALRGEGTGVAS